MIRKKFSVVSAPHESHELTVWFPKSEAYLDSAIYIIYSWLPPLSLRDRLQETACETHRAKFDEKYLLCIM